MPAVYGNLKTNTLTLQGNGAVGKDISMAVSSDTFVMSMSNLPLMTVAPDYAAGLNSGTVTSQLITLGQDVLIQGNLTVTGSETTTSSFKPVAAVPATASLLVSAPASISTSCNVSIAGKLAVAGTISPATKFLQKPVGQRQVSYGAHVAMDGSRALPNTSPAWRGIHKSTTNFNFNNQTNYSPAGSTTGFANIMDNNPVTAPLSVFNAAPMPAALTANGAGGATPTYQPVADQEYLYYVWERTNDLPNGIVNGSDLAVFVTANTHSVFGQVCYIVKQSRDTGEIVQVAPLGQAIDDYYFGTNQPTVSPVSGSLFTHTNSNASKPYRKTINAQPESDWLVQGRSNQVTTYITTDYTTYDGTGDDISRGPLAYCPGTDGKGYLYITGQSLKYASVIKLRCSDLSVVWRQEKSADVYLEKYSNKTLNTCGIQMRTLIAVPPSGSRSTVLVVAGACDNVAYSAPDLTDDGKIFNWYNSSGEAYAYADYGSYACNVWNWCATPPPPTVLSSNMFMANADGSLNPVLPIYYPLQSNTFFGTLANGDVTAGVFNLATGFEATGGLNFGQFGAYPSLMSTGLGLDYTYGSNIGGTTWVMTASNLGGGAVGTVSIPMYLDAKNWQNTFEFAKFDFTSSGPNSNALSANGSRFSAASNYLGLVQNGPNSGTLKSVSGQAIIDFAGSNIDPKTGVITPFYQPIVKQINVARVTSQYSNLDTFEQSELSLFGGGLWNNFSWDSNTDTVMFGTGNATHVPYAYENDTWQKAFTALGNDWDEMAASNTAYQAYTGSRTGASFSNLQLYANMYSTITNSDRINFLLASNNPMYIGNLTYHVLSKTAHAPSMASGGSVTNSLWNSNLTTDQNVAVVKQLQYLYWNRLTTVRDTLNYGSLYDNNNFDSFMGVNAITGSNVFAIKTMPVDVTDHASGYYGAKCGIHKPDGPNQDAVGIIPVRYVNQPVDGNTGSAIAGYSPGNQGFFNMLGQTTNYNLYGQKTVTGNYLVCTNKSRIFVYNLDAVLSASNLVGTRAYGSNINTNALVWEQKDAHNDFVLSINNFAFNGNMLLFKNFGQQTGTGSQLMPDAYLLGKEINGNQINGFGNVNDTGRCLSYPVQNRWQFLATVSAYNIPQLIMYYKNNASKPLGYAPVFNSPPAFVTQYDKPPSLTGIAPTHVGTALYNYTANCGGTAPSLFANTTGAAINTANFVQWIYMNSGLNFGSAYDASSIFVYGDNVLQGSTNSLKILDANFGYVNQTLRNPEGGFYCAPLVLDGIMYQYGGATKFVFDAPWIIPATQILTWTPYGK